jgi:hypothetical protein
MKAIQAMLRHSSLATAADTYTSLFADEGHAVAEQVASVGASRGRCGGGVRNFRSQFSPSRASEGYPAN